MMACLFHVNDIEQVQTVFVISKTFKNIDSTILWTKPSEQNFVYIAELSFK